MLIAVGSKNPIKINAARLAFKKVFPTEKIIVKVFNAASGVSDQPKSDIESITGARNRAKSALKTFSADFGVGLEGGLQEIAGEWFDCGWMVIIDKSGREGIGSTIKIHTPKKMMKYIKKGMEISQVIDVLFKQTNSKHSIGHFGFMTKGLVTRQHAYQDALIAALARFIYPEIY